MTPKEVAIIIRDAIRRQQWMVHTQAVTVLHNLAEDFADCFLFGDTPIPGFDRDAFLRDCEPEVDNEN